MNEGNGFKPTWPQVTSLKHRNSWPKSELPMVWWRTLLVPKSFEFGPPTRQMMGRFSLYAPAMALMTLNPPTVNVTAHAPTPCARAYPSAAYPAFNSLQQPTIVSSGSATRWSRRMRLKSPGTVNTSRTPISSSLRAMYRPNVHSVSGSALLPATDTVPFAPPITNGHQMCLFASKQQHHVVNFTMSSRINTSIGLRATEWVTWNTSSGFLLHFPCSLVTHVQPSVYLSHESLEVGSSYACANFVTHVQGCCYQAFISLPITWSRLLLLLCNFVACSRLSLLIPTY